jgi:hypothetical protein
MKKLVQMTAASAALLVAGVVWGDPAKDAAPAKDKPAAAAPAAAATAAAPAKPAAKPGANDPISYKGDAELTWGDGPANIPPGAKIAVLFGNPGGKGPFAVRIKMPAGYTIMPHWHPTDENLTVLSGEFMMGMGDKVDEASMMSLPVGGFGHMPAKHHHYAKAKVDTVIELHALAPFALTYVNPADDPSKAKK